MNKCKDPNWKQQQKELFEAEWKKFQETYDQAIRSHYGEACDYYTFYTGLTMHKMAFYVSYPGRDDEDIEIPIACAHARGDEHYYGDAIRVTLAAGKVFDEMNINQG